MVQSHYPEGSGGPTSRWCRRSDKLSLVNSYHTFPLGIGDYSLLPFKPI
jgi:hypothetical protein